MRVPAKVEVDLVRSASALGFRGSPGFGALPNTGPILVRCKHEKGLFLSIYVYKYLLDAKHHIRLEKQGTTLLRDSDENRFCVGNASK